MKNCTIGERILVVLLGEKEDLRQEHADDQDSRIKSWLLLNRRGPKIQELFESLHDEYFVFCVHTFIHSVRGDIKQE